MRNGELASNRPSTQFIYETTPRSLTKFNIGVSTL